MKNLAICMFLLTSCVFSSLAQECSKEISLVNSLFEKINLEQALTDPSAITAEFNTLTSSLSNFSAMSLKKDTPKLLFLNGKEKKGNAKAGKKRVYVTSLIQKDVFSIQFKNGNAMADGQIILCSHAKNGTIENLESAIITANSSPELMRFEMSGQRGKIVSITIKNTSKSEKLAFTIKGAYQ